MKILRTSILGLACLTAFVSSAEVSPAEAAQPHEPSDPHITLLNEYNRYWTPSRSTSAISRLLFAATSPRKARRSWLATTRASSKSTKPVLTRRNKSLTDKEDPNSGVPCAMR